MGKRKGYLLSLGQMLYFATDGEFCDLTTQMTNRCYISDLLLTYVHWEQHVQF